MGTTSTALVLLGDRDYLMKISGRNATDKADVLNAVTVKEAQALSDVAIVVKSESIGEAWQGGRNYLCQWLVSHFPIFDELAIRIHDRKRKGLSPLIIKSKPCSDFKEAVHLLLDTDPSYYYKLRKKHLGGGWQKSLPAEAIAPDQPTVAGERVDKVHSAANEPESPIEKKESEDWHHTDLRSHLLATFPVPEGYEKDENVQFIPEALTDFLVALPGDFFYALDEAMGSARYKRNERDVRAQIIEALTDGPLGAAAINERVDFSRSYVYEILHGEDGKLWMKDKKGRYAILPLGRELAVKRYMTGEEARQFIVPKASN